MKIDSKATLVRTFLAWAFILVLVVVVGVWYFRDDHVPQEITLFTGAEGGLYHRFGLALEKVYERQTGQGMRVISSAGSAANRVALIGEEADVAIVQAGAVSLDDLGLLSALYPEIVHVVVRKDLEVFQLEDLVGRRMILGPADSGMRQSAIEVLGAHQVMDGIIEETNRYFGELLLDKGVDGAIVTTGIFNPDLKEVLASRQFRLLPIPAAGAVQARNAYLNSHVLPMGLYGISRPVPAEDLPTLATTALLVGREDLPPGIIRNLLTAVYEGGLHHRFPALFRKDAAQDYSPAPLTKEADLFFNPADRIGQVANIMESIAAFKELAFALFAGLYLLWGRFRRFEEREKARLIQKEKDRLDEMLTETLRIEEAQVAESDPIALQRMLDEVTRIKLKALRQLTHEDLRGDRVFLIFLTQCSSLIGKIQAKMGQVRIPAFVGHLIRFIPDSDSDSVRTGNPVHIGHPIRSLSDRHSD